MKEENKLNKEVQLKINKMLENFENDKADIGDIGNEIVIIFGSYINTEDDMINFINGIEHGISIIDGSHYKNRKFIKKR